MKTLDDAELRGVNGGLQWERYGQSTNVEDRRTKRAIAQDEAWWRKTHPATPLPPPRPKNL